MNESASMPQWRGYIGSRSYHRELPPQNVQNLVVRSFCQQHGANYLLSLTEYAMPESYLMLNEVLREAEQIDGLVLYSLYMLPVSYHQRNSMVKQLLDQGVSVHGAAENLSVYDASDWQAVDDMLCLHHSLEGLQTDHRLSS